MKEDTEVQKRTVIDATRETDSFPITIRLTHNLQTHVPSSSSTTTPLSQPISKPSSASDSRRRAYLSDEHSMASADLRALCDVCDLEVECRARFDSVLDIESV